MRDVARDSERRRCGIAAALSTSRERDGWCRPWRVRFFCFPVRTLRLFLRVATIVFFSSLPDECFVSPRMHVAFTFHASAILIALCTYGIVSRRVWHRFVLRVGDDVEVASFAGPVAPDPHANGRPPLVRVERIVRVADTVWLHARRFRYHAAVNVPTGCSIVRLADEAVAAEVLPVGALFATALLVHACAGLVSPQTYAAALAAAGGAGGGGGGAVAAHLPCVWCDASDAGRAFGRMREIQHAAATRRTDLVNRGLR